MSDSVAPRTIDEWEPIFERFHASGQSQAAFCRAELVAMSGDVDPDDEGIGTDEDSASNTGEAAADAAGNPAPPSKPRKPRRPRVLPDHRERVRVVHELDEAERHAACGGRLVPIGEEITEQLGMMPATHFVIQHVKIKYARACKGCGVMRRSKKGKTIDKSWISTKAIGFYGAAQARRCTGSSARSSH